MSAREAAEQHGCTGGPPGRPKREQSNNCPGTRSNGAQKQSTERVIRSLRGLGTKHKAEKQLPRSRVSTSTAGGGPAAATLCLSAQARCKQGTPRWCGRSGPGAPAPLPRRGQAPVGEGCHQKGMVEATQNAETAAAPAVRGGNNECNCPASEVPQCWAGSPETAATTIGDLSRDLLLLHVPNTFI